MISDDVLFTALAKTITESSFPQLGEKITGKVRDCYVVKDKRVLVSTDRLSAFDVVLSSVPFKGQLLNDLTSFWFEKTSDLIPNHVISRPHPNVFIAKELKIIPIEIVVRGYLSGSAWRDYQAGRDISGISLPGGLKKSEKLAFPLVTPSTKAASGSHDQPVSKEDILKEKIITEELWVQIEETALQLFYLASQEVSKTGLLLFDTKFEFGLLDLKDGTQELFLADEIFTQDCSRYAVAETYEKRLSEGRDPEMLDKEFIRSWLMERGYMGEGTPPEFPGEFRVEIARKYIAAYEIITGETFLPCNEEIQIDEILQDLAENTDDEILL
jgi:phosphoribosylaminoimidazole-succinocarboxamide synthase